MAGNCIETNLIPMHSIPSILSIPTFHLKKIYPTLPYVFEFSNREVKMEFSKLMHRFYPQLYIFLIFKNSFENIFVALQKCNATGETIDKRIV